LRAGTGARTAIKADGFAAPPGRHAQATLSDGRK